MSENIKSPLLQETHTVQSEDGYILSLTRVVNDLQNSDKNSEKQENQQSSRSPVLLVHGLMSSGQVWFLQNPNLNLPAKLFKGGFDCWIANIRGTSPSRQHIQLKTNSRKYWDFSFQEIGYYDIPAIIDYILDLTGEKSIFYIGHSMGCSVFTVCMTTKPEYNSKVKAMIALAPACYMNNIRNKPVRFIAPLLSTLGKVKLFRKMELCPKTASKQLNCACVPSKTADRLLVCLGAAICRFCGAIGNDPIDKDLVLPFLSLVPSPTSMKTIVHGMQCVTAKRCQQFDFGRATNIKIYGQAVPPVYDFKKITTPTATFYADDDELCTAEDVTQLSKDLPNSIGHYRISRRGFAHADFQVGVDAHDLVYDTILEILKNCQKCSSVDNLTNEIEITNI